MVKLTPVRSSTSVDRRIGGGRDVGGCRRFRGDVSLGVCSTATVCCILVDASEGEAELI